MKVLFAIDSQSVSNPFIITLCEKLKKYNIDVTISLNELWSHIENYDIIHFQWPEAIYSWKRAISTEQVNKLLIILQKARKNGIKIVITCHNLKPHTIIDKNVISLYDIIYRNGDLFLHMGSYSLNILKSQYPNAKHYILPHHTYDTIYKFERQKDLCRSYLGIPENRFCILCFGEFRTDQERNLILELKGITQKSILFVTPGFFRQKLLSKHPIKNIQNIIKAIKYRIKGIKYSRKFINITDTERYFCATDIVMIQRVDILNSGNLPMAFAAGKVVIGPDKGNVGEILRQTGNPTFTPTNPYSIIDAINKAKELVSSGKGQWNKAYAEKHWTTNIITQQLIHYYNKVL